MTSNRLQRFEEYQRQILEQLLATNVKLDKIAAILLSNQLLEECVSPEGEVRSPEECADIVRESFCAGLCISKELDKNHKNFQYHLSEFYMESEENEDEDEEDYDKYEEDDDEEDDDEGPFSSNFAVKFG